MKPYTITNPEQFKKELNLDFQPPHGALINETEHPDKCVIKFVPPMTKREVYGKGNSIEEIELTKKNEDLQSLLFKNIIKPKETANSKRITKS